MGRLTWADLLIDNFSREQVIEWLSPWRGRNLGQAAPVLLNKFGQWFFQRREGHIDLFDVLTGEMQTIAPDHQAFVGAMNDPSWQRQFLLTDTVASLLEAGKTTAPDQCYALAPHPWLGGPNPAKGEAIEPRFVAVLSVGVWQNLCAQALSYPAGYRPTKFVYEGDLPKD